VDGRIYVSLERSTTFFLLTNPEGVMLNKILITIGLLGILAGGGLWINDGMHVFSKDREEVVREFKDELFGTIRREIEYIPAFKFGLLPVDATISDTPRCYAFVGGVSLSLIAFGLWRSRKSPSTP
jgi:hypothetical protein